MLVQATFSVRLGLQTSSALIAQATQCSQALQLNSEKAIQSGWESSEDQLNARKAFWYLYSLEKPHCLLRGTFSVGLPLSSHSDIYLVHGSCSINLLDNR